MICSQFAIVPVGPSVNGSSVRLQSDASVFRHAPRSLFTCLLCHVPSYLLNQFASVHDGVLSSPRTTTRFPDPPTFELVSLLLLSLFTCLMIQPRPLSSAHSVGALSTARGEDPLATDDNDGDDDITPASDDKNNSGRGGRSLDGSRECGLPREEGNVALTDNVRSTTSTTKPESCISSSPNKMIPEQLSRGHSRRRAGFHSTTMTDALSSPSSSRRPLTEESDDLSSSNQNNDASDSQSQSSSGPRRTVKESVSSREHYR